MDKNGHVSVDLDGIQRALGDDVSRDRTNVSARWATALRRLMDQRGITQLELAALAGIDKDTVTNIMRGESSSISTMEKLAQALGVDVSELALTGEQSRILAEYRLRGEDLARRISRELSAAHVTATPSTPLGANSDNALEAPRWPDHERRSGRDRRESANGQSRAGRRAINEPTSPDGSESSELT